MLFKLRYHFKRQAITDKKKKEKVQNWIYHSTSLFDDI